MGGDLKFCDIEIGEAVTIGDITIENALLNHPGEAVRLSGYPGRIK